jgi:Restriction endonuclease AspBHI N-terminal/Restriction endonuclease
MQIGQIFAYRRPYSESPPVIDGIPNYFNITYKAGVNKPLLEKGISNVAVIKAPEGDRTPVILISSSPHKTGTQDTPWQDFFDPDNGHIRYYGDNKTANQMPENSPGNNILLRAFDIHNSLDKTLRKYAIPILFFKRVTYKKRAKGNLMFQGFGIVERVERVTQYSGINKEYFSNYVFDFSVFSLKDDAEVFNWDWINARRNQNLSLEETISHAPQSWQNWVREGTQSIERYRRRVSKLLTTKSKDQRPKPNSNEEKALYEIYKFYDGKKARFEGLASVVAQRILSSHDNSYIEGWITPSSSDGGSDFVGRLDIGSAFSKTKLVVLGQAKCEKPEAATGGNHIARTVARLKRGWIGVYVTTSYFSESVQREVIDDGYPIVLVHGLRLAEEVLEMVYEKGFSSTAEFLKDIDNKYIDKILARRPEEILYL